MIRLNLTTSEPDLTVTLIDAWYDRDTRSWVVQRMNKAGDQIGEAAYLGTKGDARYEVAQLKALHPTARIAWSS